MKIIPSNIQKFLHEQQFIKFKAILFYGNNTGLIKKYINIISEKFLQHDSSSEEKSLNNITLNHSVIAREPDILFNEIAALSFFGDKKIILINEAHGAISQSLKEMLLNHQNGDILIIFQGTQISPKDQLRKFFESELNLAIIACYPEKLSDIEKTISARLKEAGIHVEQRDIIKYIANNIGEDSGYISSEIDKIISSHDKKNPITLQEVKTIISKSSNNADCDKYISLLIEEKFQLAESELKKLMLADIKPHFIIKALSQYFTRLYIAHGLLAEGISEIEIPKKLNPPIFFKNIPIFKLALQRYNVTKIIQILQHLLNLEIKLKSHDPITAKIILEQALFNIFYSNHSVISPESQTIINK